MPQNDGIRVRVTMLVVVILALVGMLLGACAPQRRPDGAFPRTGARPRPQFPAGVVELGQARCMGGGLGGCGGWHLGR